MVRYLARPLITILGFSSGACAGQLSSTVVAAHPAIELELPRPTVVAASAAERPVWLERGGRGHGEEIVFIGQGQAPRREDAKRRAIRDLFVAVARYIKTDVQSSFEATETHRARDGEIEETFTARSEIRAQIGAAVDRLEGASIYWEQIETPGRGRTFHYYVHASIPRDQLTRGARLSALKSERLVVIVTVPSSAPTITAALQDELADRLAGRPGFVIWPRSRLESLLPDRLEDDPGALERQLEPTLLVELWGERRENRIRLRYVVRAPSGGVEPAIGELERAPEELFELQDALVAALASDLTARLEALAKAEKRGPP